MLDKLCMTSPRKVSQETLLKNLQGYFTSRCEKSTNFHNKLLVLYNGKRKDDCHVISLHLEPNPKYRDIAPLKIEINPSRFESKDKMDALLEKVTDLEELKIVRIDHAVDLSGHSVEDVKKTILLSRKHSREVFKKCTELTGFYLGKPPEVLVIYDKKNPYDEVQTRVELRHFRYKVPIKEYNRLSEYLSESPFNAVKFLTLKNGSNPNGYDSRKRAQYEFLSQEHGAQFAYKYLNRGSNFKRDFKDLIIERKDIPDLNELYRENLVHFFKGAN